MILGDDDDDAGKFYVWLVGDNFGLCRGSSIGITSSQTVARPKTQIVARAHRETVRLSTRSLRSTIDIEVIVDATCDRLFRIVVIVSAGVISVPSRPCP